MIATSSRRHL